jgi:putative ABC transport system permease protein
MTFKTAVSEVEDPHPTERRWAVKSDQAASALALALSSLKAHVAQSVLTMLGIAVGAACVVLVVSVGLTGKQYVLHTIEGIGSNIIALDYAYGGPGEPGANASRDDYLKISDERAVEEQVRVVTASSPMLTLRQPLTLGHGMVRDVQILGVAPEYRTVRNLRITHGRFFDSSDSRVLDRAAVLTPGLAQEMFGSAPDAVGRSLDISGLPFTVIGICKERVETFGQSELNDRTVLIPYSVARTIMGTDEVNQIFFSVQSLSEVDEAAAEISSIIKLRHRRGSDYRITTLTGLLKAAGSIADALTVVLILVTLVTLIAGGIGIMNIMLATVASRVQEIGLRKSLGATQRMILLQFLSEAVVISLLGGLVGTSLALAVPLAVRLFTPFAVTVSYWSVAAALAAACSVGIIFGTMPAMRAARYSPLDALRNEP